MRPVPKPPATGGFSLLELLVAIAIMAMALGMIYRAAGGSARQVGETGRRVQAVMLAESLLASYDVVPPAGLSDQGESAGLAWQVRSQPHPTDVNDPKAPLLHQLTVLVSWDDGGKARQLELLTVLPQQLPLAGAVVR